METDENPEVGQLRGRIIRSSLRNLIALPVGLRGERISPCSKRRANGRANEPIYRLGPP